MAKTQQEGFDLNLSAMDFWSISQEELIIPAVAADVVLPGVTVVGLLSGVTIVRVVAMFKFRIVENINVGTNKLSGAQEIQIKVHDAADGTYIDAINFVDDQFGLAASTREGGDVIIGSIDVKATVTGNDTYSFWWNQALADLVSINFNDLQMGIKVWFR